jgi:quinol monooxygenase YgiN
MVTIVWETRLKPCCEEEGLNLTRRIWADMTGFEGYLSHFILVDEDASGHLLVVSTWASRDSADKILNEYAQAEPVRLITPLLAAPRNRWVFSRVNG